MLSNSVTLTLAALTAEILVLVDDMMVAQNPYSSIVRAPATFRQVTRVFFLHAPDQDPGWSYPLVPVQKLMQGRRNFHGVVTQIHRRSRYS
jgi:hypothetical protein